MFCQVVSNIMINNRVDVDLLLEFLFKKIKLLKL